jgi:hypothetical protein
MSQWCTIMLKFNALIFFCITLRMYSYVLQGILLLKASDDSVETSLPVCSAYTNLCKHQLKRSSPIHNLRQRLASYSLPADSIGPTDLEAVIICWFDRKGKIFVMTSPHQVHGVSCRLLLLHGSFTIFLKNMYIYKYISIFWSFGDWWWE